MKVLTPPPEVKMVEWLVFRQNKNDGDGMDNVGRYIYIIQCKMIKL